MTLLFCFATTLWICLLCSIISTFCVNVYSVFWFTLCVILLCPRRRHSWRLESHCLLLFRRMRAVLDNVVRFLMSFRGFVLFYSMYGFYSMFFTQECIGCRLNVKEELSAVRCEAARSEERRVDARANRFYANGGLLTSGCELRRQCQSRRGARVVAEKLELEGAISHALRPLICLFVQPGLLFACLILTLILLTL